MTTARSIHRRTASALGSAWLAADGTLTGCSPETPTFKSTDITGAAFAQDLKLTDHTGQVSTMADFRGKAAVDFFGFTQCPDACPSSVATLAEFKLLRSDKGARLQVLFISVDPERATRPLLKEYMANFDPTFLALRPEPSELKGVADSFKSYYREAEGSTPTSYTTDHSAGKYVFDTEDRVRLFSSYRAGSGVIAEDVHTLLKSMNG